MPTFADNPFFLLGASPRDDRRRIIELAEEKSLTLDPELCAKARADLTNPRNRLAAEVAWLPGMAPEEAGKLLEAMAAAPLKALAKLGGAVPLLSLANLLAHAMEGLGQETGDRDWKQLLLQFAEAAEYMDPREVARDINKDRAASGFPEVPGLDAVEAEIAERRRYYKQAAKEALNRLPTLRLVEVVSCVVEASTLSGTEHAPLLVNDLLDGYELEAQTFLQREGENAKRLVESILADAARGAPSLAAWLDRLERVLRNWSRVARPVQTIMKTRGLSHAPSNELFNLVRSMGIYLFNERGLVDAEVRVLGLLREVFDVSPEMAEVLAGDLAYMEKIGVKLA